MLLRDRSKSTCFWWRGDLGERHEEARRAGKARKGGGVEARRRHEGEGGGGEGGEREGGEGRGGLCGAGHQIYSFSISAREREECGGSQMLKYFNCY